MRSPLSPHRCRLLAWLPTLLLVALPTSGAMAQSVNGSGPGMPSNPGLLQPIAEAPAAVDTAPPHGATAGPGTEERATALEARVQAMQRALDALDALQSEKPGWLRMFRVSGFVQGQLLWQWFNTAASPNLMGGALLPGLSANSVVAKPDPTTGIGITTNGDYFRIRRARLKTELTPTDFARLVLEIDPTPPGWNGGVGTIMRQVEAQGIVRWSGDLTTELAVGFFKVPFGFEIQQYDADRPFLERSWGERNMFPGEYDTGARAYTRALRTRLTVQFALLNGVTEGEKTFALVPDLNHGKDLVGRANYSFEAFDVGVSGYYGQGQIVDAVGLRFKQFPRWAANLEAALHHTWLHRLGETRVFGETTLAQNMDRGTNYGFALPAFPADVVNGRVTDLNEWAAWARLEQDITRRFTLGLRCDFYTPDLSQTNDGRVTYDGLLMVHFRPGLRYIVEFDHVVDNVHAPGGRAPGKQVEQLSSVLQVRF